MKCPFCGTELENGALFCSECKQPLPVGLKDEKSTLPPRFYERWYFRALFLVICIIVALFILGVGVYKLYYWVDDYSVNRAYTRGAQTPVISEIEMDDGRSGHAFTFFGNDGGQVFIPELDRSAYFSGNVARFEVPDAMWFEANVTEELTAEITLSPLLIKENGDRVQLPLMNCSINTPPSVLNIKSPKQDKITVSTAIYPLDLTVYPGSTLYVNGEDVTSMVDRAGAFSANLNIYPVGDNVISILVKSPHHIETRKDLVIHRAQLEIEVELDPSVKMESSSKNMTVTGKIEPGAALTVDTPHIKESVYFDMESGLFSFVTEFSTYGDNIVRFRATKEGKSDSVISFTVQYRPTLADYSKVAWKMDYPQLRRMFEQWRGRVFLCEGEVTRIWVEDNKQYVMMDVGTGGESNLVILVNESSIGTPVAGREYSAYAHVDGRMLYDGQYYPLLTSLYMDVRKVD